MSLPVWLCCSNNQRRRRSLYIICVIVARILGDYVLANLIDYIIRFTDLKFMHLSSAEAAAVVNAKDGLAGICGVIGAILVDVYLTNYGMIFFSSLLYGVGLVFIIWGFISDSSTIALLAVGISLAGAGNLSLMNSSNTLAKEERDANQSNTNFITNFIEFVFGDETDISRLAQAHGSVILLTFVKYAAKVMFIVVAMVLGRIIQDDPNNSGYIIFAQFLIPTGSLLLMALISLVNVKLFVKPVEDRGTPLVICFCTTAFSKSCLHCHQNLTKGEIFHEGSPEHQFAHTKELRSLDKAAMVDLSQPEEHRNQQRLCTVTEVEETKRLLHMVPMCMTFLLYGMVKSVGSTFFLIQGKLMDSSLGKLNIEVPLQTLIIIGEISGLLTKGLYIVLISKRLSGPGKRYGSPIKYAIGIVLATFCCTVASWTADDKGEGDSMFWLTPQFLLFGAMSEVTREGIQGFFHEQLPPSIRRYDSVFTDAIIGVGANLCTALVYATHSNGKINLHIFYRFLTVACFVILSAYTFVAIRYRYQDSQEAQSNQEVKE